MSDSKEAPSKRGTPNTNTGSNFQTPKWLVTAVVRTGLFALASFWLNQVSKYVPEPYLDEVFHIPQAQRYCQRDLEWDPKITTPPGLYAFSILIKTIFRSTCSVYNLRQHNVIFLFALSFYASRCRTLIEQIPPISAPRNADRSWRVRLMPTSSYSLHTATNIALFPPLFFFSGLYYTDVLSTCIVLAAYEQYLQRWGAYTGASGGAMRVFVWGLVSLAMRQTNIFWVAVFMGGCETVRIVKALGRNREDKTPLSYTGFSSDLRQYALGRLHDARLDTAGPYDFVLCAVSIAVGVLNNLLCLAKHLWPYVGLLCSFAAFVAWNGGVVLGDKSNHVATIHLPQMLYIWPVFVFFSAPLLYPFGLELVRTFLPRSNYPLRTVLQTLAGLAIASAIALFVVHFNTIIHPFTLADNRHYVFYAFRYTILRHPLIKYALAPVYALCGWLTLRGLAGYGARAASSNPPSQQQSRVLAQAPQPDGNDTSFVLIWLIATALSLITAPLVEPRYFIIPWVIWRLHVPAAPVKSESESSAGGRYWAFEGHDHRLWLETIWFLGINAVTGYVFLTKGFEWPQEPGLVQRFLW